MVLITFLNTTSIENQEVKIINIDYQITCLPPDYVRVGEVSQIDGKPASGILCMTTPPAARITFDMTEKEVAELSKLSNKITKIIIKDYENEKCYYIDNPILVQKEDVIDAAGGKKRYCFESININIGEQSKEIKKYLRLYCYQVNEWNKSTIFGERAVYYLPISDSEEKEIRSKLTEKPYIQFTTAENSTYSQLYCVEYIDKECNVSSSLIQPKKLITSYKFCEKDYVWIICDDNTGKYKNVIFSIDAETYKEKTRKNENILAINDEFAIKIYLLREDVDNSIKSLFQRGSCNWIVKDIQYHRPISFCHITDYVNFSGITRHSKINDLAKDSDKENVFSVDKDDVNLLTDNPSLIQSSFITTQAETKIKTTKPCNFKKEDNSMKMNMNEIFGDTIGRYTSGTIKYSPKGLAFLTDNYSYVVYDVDTLAATNVANLVMDIPVYGIPVALKDLKKGDTIVYNEAYYLVKAITDTHISAINVRKGTIENLIPKTSIFGFSFYVKLVTPMENFKPDPSNPFGSMLPFLMLEDSGNDDSMKDIMMISMMSGGAINSSMLPLMMMMNKNGGDKNDLLMMMMLMGNNPFAPKTPESTSAPTPKSAPTSPWTPQTALLNFPLDKGFMENE